jgi:hypothetical protein
MSVSIQEEYGLLADILFPRQILRHYMPQVDEPPIPSVLIDCMRARAMASVDKVRRPSYSRLITVS